MHKKEIVTDSNSTPSFEAPRRHSTPQALFIPEILLNIFSHLRPKSRDRTLSRLARVCSAWRGPAVTLLYESIHLNWRFSNQRRQLLFESCHNDRRLFSMINPCLWHIFREDQLWEEVADEYLESEDMKSY